MNSLPEQFSAARQAQLDNGFNLMRSFSDQALDRTSRVFALQLGASRAAVEQSSNAMRQLLAARDPRDLLAIGSQSQQHLRTMLDYSRELFSIATAGMSMPMLGSVGAQAQNAPAAPAASPLPRSVETKVETKVDTKAEAAAAEAFERIGADTASAAASAAEAAAESVAESAAESVTAADAVPADAVPEVQAAPGADFALPTETAEPATASVVTSETEPGGAQTVMAKATSEALDVPVGLPHPVAASLPVEVAVEIEMPKIEPVDATPPHAAATTGPVDTRGTKGRRKQQN